jgi:hypothetical protein
MGVAYTSKNRFLVQVTVIASEINIVEWGESRETLRIHDTIVILKPVQILVVVAMLGFTRYAVDRRCYDGRGIHRYLLRVLAVHVIYRLCCYVEHSGACAH